MSDAGIYSNRGGCYQTLVAFDWALTVLDDLEYLWIEVDEWLNIIFNMTRNVLYRQQKYI